MGAIGGSGRVAEEAAAGVAGPVRAVFRTYTIRRWLPEIPEMWVDGFNYRYYAGRKAEGQRLEG